MEMRWDREHGGQRTKAQILVIEDELITAEHIQRALRALDYEVPAVVVSGEEAVRMADELRPDLMLMDIKLRGEMDGIEATAQIRAQLDIPVVYLSGYADEETVERAKITGPYSYLFKPYDVKDMHAIIEMALYKYEVDKRLRESEVRYHSLFDRVPVGLYRTTPDGRIFEANSAAARVLGYPDRESLLAVKMPDLCLHRESQAEFWTPAECPEGVHSFEVQLRRGDGAVIWAKVVVQSIRDDEGQVLHYEGVIEDISERKRAEAADR